jgi:hypothetical protein
MKRSTFLGTLLAAPLAALGLVKKETFAHTVAMPIDSSKPMGARAAMDEYAQKVTAAMKKDFAVGESCIVPKSDYTCKFDIQTGGINKRLWLFNPADIEVMEKDSNGIITKLKLK